MMKTCVLALAIVGSLAALGTADNRLAQGFLNPPDSAKPWVYWFWINGNISKEDIAFLQAIPGYGASTDDTQLLYGVNARLDAGRFTLIGQALKGETGRLDRKGWFIQPSYKIQLSDRPGFNAFEFVYRYNQLDVDLSNVFASPLTWDREQHVFAVITDVVQNIKLKTEYYLNREDTGGGGVDNDEFLVQLEVKF